ncbi:hypothetical protein [Chondrinema litorale]|uniref:hypothetical protein n=1 Tax=Chondrinema litorale TaxID=2994555 RepID=UPI002543B9D6|nr:hypothetical protein [Chondrinema litorale]UZR95009.1 hypothetical protein OQ292_04165 [Chondrinema litorale]
MRHLTLTLLFCISFLSALFAGDPGDVNLKKGFVTGNPEIKSISSMDFGPQNLLFIGDATSASVIAVDMSGKSEEQSSEVNIKNVDKTLAMQLGTTVDQIEITDMAVHPGTKQIFLAVQHSSGKSMLFKVEGEKFVSVPLDEVSHSKQSLVDAVSEDAEDRRGRSLRQWAISDLNYENGKIMLTGLSNKEFGSTFRSITFPFTAEQSYGSLEIYHAAHGQYETQSPVKTFMPITLNDEPYIIASYTCTPLVVFPMSELQNGEHTKGRTVAELGNWNTPLDIIELSNGDERFVLLANSSRALMKIKVNDIETFSDYLTSPVEERSATDGVGFIALPFVNVLQLAKMSDDTFAMLQRNSAGELVLSTGGNRWL